MIRLPGVCTVCGDPVVWNGRQWKRADNLRYRHACRADRPTCGAWMLVARESCARAPGHTVGAHRTRYAMDNARRAA